MNTLAFVVLGLMAALEGDSDGQTFVKRAGPLARVSLSEAGWVRLATNVSTASFGDTPESAARAFLRREGAALGLVNGDEGLVLAHSPQAGEFATLVFNRVVDGLPVVNGQVMVAVTPDGRVHTVSSTGPLPVSKSAFVVDAEGARRSALARLDGAVTNQYAGWFLSGDELRAVHVVYMVKEQPSYQSHRFVVDAVTGQIGLSPSLLQANQGRVYRVSPSKPAHPAPACQTTTDMNGNIKYATCAQPEEVTLQGLAPGSRTLTGDPTRGVGRTTVYNCRGATQYNTMTCSQTLMADSNGNFLPTLDYGTNKNDTSAELMAYYHVDKHSRFIDSLDRTFPGLPLIPGYTNAYGPSLLPFGGQSAPLDNAFYDPSRQIMVFGQGSSLDFAFDAEVVYHEVTHAACDAIGRIARVEGALSPIAFSGGLFVDPFSINEGNADMFAAMEPDVWDPTLGEFDARTEVSLLPFLPSIPIGPKGYIRNLAPMVAKTCQGNGTAANPGRDGESHDDGEIWGGFAWEVFQGLQGLPQASAQPGGSAAAPVMMKALQSLIALPISQQSFVQFANLVSSQTRAMYGNEAGAFVECLKTKHDIDTCDGQAVTVYSGEGPFNDMVIQNAWKAFYFSKAELYQNMPPAGFEGVPAGVQWKIAVPAGATELEIKVCDPQGSGKVFLQKGKPVEMSTTGMGMMADFQYPISASRSADYGGCGGGLLGAGSPLTLKLTPTSCTVQSGNAAATPCRTSMTLTADTLAQGDWYVLTTNMGQQASFAKANFRLTAPSVPTRPAAMAPAVCRLAGAVTPPDAGSPPVDAGMTRPDAGVATADAGSVDAGEMMTTPDAGQPTMVVDAGVGGSVDAGTCVGAQCGPQPKPCGCTSGVGLVPFILAASLLRRRRGASSSSAP